MCQTELNKIYNIDCLEGMNLIPDNSIDLVIIDPPYKIKTTGAGIYKQSDKKYIEEIESISNGFDTQILDVLCLKMKKTNIYIWCSKQQIIPLLNYFAVNRKCNYNIISWHKTNPVPACGNKYLTDTEYCLFFREKGVKIYGNFHSKFTYYVTSLNVKEKAKYRHPTVKPLEIIKNFVINSSRENDMVLDCFLGSGTTAVACIDTNRKYIGFEIDKEYFKNACKRIENAKNQVKP